jgi:diketogulonate reductase-like aldo/keto reductase
MSKEEVLLSYGLYQVPFDQVADCIQLAHQVGITHFDTAQLYHNEKQTAENCTLDDFITTKIFHHNKIHNMIKRSVKRFGRPINRMLLHNPMPTEAYKIICSYLGTHFDSVGISNYNREQLEQLIVYCQTEKLPLPSIHQMEIHPFIDCEPLIEYCHSNHILVEAHTVLTRGTFLSFEPLMQLAIKYEVSPAVILFQWAKSKGIHSICIHSKSLEHLSELVRSNRNPNTDYLIATSDLAEMNLWHLKKLHRFYGKKETINTISSLNPFHLEQIVNQLKKDIKVENLAPSNLCEIVPIVGDSYRTVGPILASKLFPEAKSTSSALNLYRNAIKQLRTKRCKHHKVQRQFKKGLPLASCNIVRTSGPYSESIQMPRPMPVDITEPEEFDSFFDYLRKADENPHSDQVFVRGAFFPDGRMDLCKQVVGPRSIVDLCETVLASTIVKHFLLGNNVALQSNEEEGAKAIAKVMRASSNQIVTWYLAGNCIGPKGISIMAHALETNTVCKALWLKRNPLGPLGAASLGNLLAINTTLVLLDLHNCALFDEGLHQLFLSFGEPHTSSSSLKHLYLDANGIEHGVADAIAKWKQPKTLFLSINRLGDDEIEKLAKVLYGNSSLKRLCLASTHMNNRGLSAIVETVLSCPKLQSLDVGSYKSTRDLGEHPGNFFDDESFDSLHKLLTHSKFLRYLNTTKCKMSLEKLLALPRLPHISMDLGVGPWHHMHDPKTLRFIKQPKRVVDIDSIYRGKM